MKHLLLIVLMCGLAVAGTPALTTYDAKAFTLSVPKGWTVVADASKGTVVAQQDPKRKDAAQMLVMVASGTSTDDQVLDALLKSIGNVKVVKRDPLPGGVGKLLVADGTTDGIKVRLGAIAVGNASGVIVGMLIAKTGDFDALGGTNTVIAVLGTIKAAGATTTTTATTSSAPAASGSSEVMTPQYDSYKTLIVPPPRRAITQADMAGDWKLDSGVVSSYASSATGGYAGYTAVSVSEAYSVDGKGNLTYKESAARVSSVGQGNFQSSGAGTGSMTIAPDRVISLALKGRPTTYYLLMGWFVGPEVTIMRINGPFNRPDQITDAVRGDNSNRYLDKYYVRKTR